MKFKNDISIITYHNYINLEHIKYHISGNKIVLISISHTHIVVEDLIIGSSKKIKFTNKLSFTILIIKQIIFFNKKYKINKIFIHEVGLAIPAIFSYYFLKIKNLTFMVSDFFYYKKNLKKNYSNNLKFFLEIWLIRISKKIIHYSETNFRLRRTIFDLNKKENLIFPLIIKSRKPNIKYSSNNSFVYFGPFRKETDLNLLKEILLHIKYKKLNINFNKFGYSNTIYDKEFEIFCNDNELNNIINFNKESLTLDEIRKKISHNTLAIYFINKPYFENYSYGHLPSKILEYLSLNLPIICNSSTGYTFKFIVKNNLGLSINSSKDFINTFDTINKNRFSYQNNIFNFIDNNRNLNQLNNVLS